MKLRKYFVPLICPWCGRPITTVNHSYNRPVIACEICIECQKKLNDIKDYIIFLVDDAWLADGVQAAKIPIYPFVRGVIITKTMPPPVPQWNMRFAVLPVSMAIRIGFPADVIKRAATSDTGPIVLTDDEPATEFSHSLPIMPSGTC